MEIYDEAGLGFGLRVSLGFKGFRVYGLGVSGL